MTETHGIGRRCVNESTLIPEYFHRQFLRPQAQKLAMRLRRRLLAASQLQAQSLYILNSRLVHKYPTSNRNIQ